MNCYNQLQLMEDCINNNGGFSYAKLDELNEKNELRKMFQALNIDILFRYELSNFICILDNPNYLYHEHLRKIHLHESEFIKIFGKFGYVLSLYFNNKEAYKVFPLFFKESCDYFNVGKYSNKPLEEIEELLNKYMDLNKEYNPNDKRVLTEIMGKIPGYYTNYSKYDKKLNNINEVINCSNQEEFFVYSEYEAYQRELHAIAAYNLSNPKEYVKWVSRYYGDGYGYDVLSYDIKKNREKLIEVKSGRYDSFELTPNEYKVMMSTMYENYSDYYIYRYRCDVNSNTFKLNILKFNKKHKNFYDVNTNEIYKIIPFYDEDNGVIKEYIDIVPEVKYIKKLKEKR